MFSTPWSWDAWFVAEMMVQWSTLAGMRPTLASQLDDCSSVLEIQWTKSSRGMDRRRGGFASEARRLYSADTHVCASARYKNATLKLQSALRDHATSLSRRADRQADESALWPCVPLGVRAVRGARGRVGAAARRSRLGILASASPRMRRSNQSTSLHSIANVLPLPKRQG